MASDSARKSNEFVVSLGDVKLPDPVAARIEQAIRKAALAVIADLDLTDDLPIRFPPGLRGIYIDLARQKMFR
jgi:hypothetical protein